MTDMPPVRVGPSTLSILRIFFKIGATAFGGQGAAVAVMQRELVDERKLLTSADIIEALTYSVLLPGPTMFEIAAYLGYRLGGWTGSLAASTAFLIVPVLSITVAAAAYSLATALPAVGLAGNGIAAAASGLVLATAYRMGQTSLTSIFALGIGVTACSASVMLHFNTALIVIGAGLVGVLFLQSPATDEATGHGP